MSLLQKIKKNIPTPTEIKYLHYRKQAILKRTILLEASHGRELSGHIYALAKEIQKSYPDYSFFIALREDAVIPKGFNKQIVKHGSDKYLSLLARAEILMNDTSFWQFFHKREAQRYYIFWHGTPLKCLGKATQVQGYGNVQRNLAAADQVFVSNEFTREKLVKDFGLEKIIDNEMVVGPSPRNSQLFINQVVPGRYFYMPTWRGVDVSKVQLQEDLYSHLKALDQGLKDSEELYIKLHPYEAQLLDFKEADYQHIKLFPSDRDVYEFLQTVEKLITDYSSIMFDFALTQREVLLFTYDKKAYLADRGFYLEMETLPFPQFECVESLLKGLRKKNIIVEDESICNFYRYDTVNGSQIILEYLLEQKENPLIHVSSNWNQKENVLIYAYQLADNGITASLMNLFERADLSRRNYILIWQEGMIPKHLEYKIQQLPKEVFTFIQMPKVQATFLETIATLSYMNGLPLFKKRMAQMYQRDFQRCFPHLRTDSFIHYPGYDRSYCVWTWALQPLGISTSLFVHTDMEKEFQVNPSLKPKIIYEAYEKATKVVCVTNAVEKKVHAKVPDANTRVMNVVLNEQKIQEKAAHKNGLILPESLEAAFSDKEVTVFISVGRFSKQKGYDRLIEAFEQLENRQTRLVLVCSYGPEKNNLQAQIKQSSRQKDIYLFEQCVNPYYLVKRADAFVLASRYEGLGMVVFESLALKTPVIMTRIPETLEVLASEEYAIVVENTREGIFEGLQRFLAGDRPHASFDFVTYEKRSLANWEQLFNKN